MNAETMIDASGLCDEADALGCAIVIEYEQTAGCDGQQTSDAIYAATNIFGRYFIFGINVSLKK
jgi:hypothetical protein